MSTKSDFPRESFDRLCIIEKRLHKWAERLCNGDVQYDEDKECFYSWQNDPRLGRCGPVYKCVDLEAKYLAEANRIAAKCGARIYHQPDPRGCSLYIYRDSDLVGRSYPIDQIYSSAAVACLR